MAKIITLKNKTFNSIEEACKYYNLKYNTICVRLKRGWTLEEAFELVSRKNGSCRPITVDGKTFRSVNNACKYCNLNRMTVIGRLNKGWTVEEAFELVERENNSFKPITVGDKTFKSIRQAARYHKLDDNTVHGRLKRGWSIEEAFELVQRGKKEINMANKEIIVDGKTFKTKKEAAEYYNLNEETVCGRLRRGWSIEEAFELVKRKRIHGIPKEITVGGITFKSIAKACRYHNLKEPKVRSRLDLGWSMEEAFELVPRKKR